MGRQGGRRIRGLSRKMLPRRFDNTSCFKRSSNLLYFIVKFSIELTFLQLTSQKMSQRLLDNALCFILNLRYYIVPITCNLLFTWLDSIRYTRLMISKFMRLWVEESLFITYIKYITLWQYSKMNSNSSNKSPNRK